MYSLLDQNINKSKTKYLIIIFLCFLYFNPFSSVKAAPESLNETELNQQILILNEYLMNQMITKKPPGEPLPKDLPNLSILTQLYESAADGLRATGICTACNIGIGLLMYNIRVLNVNETNMESLAIMVCKLFKLSTPDFCEGMVARYGPTFAFIFKERPLITSSTFCGVMLQSYGCTTLDPLLEWTVDVPQSNKSEREERRINSKIYKPLPDNDNTGRVKIIQLTDLHIDPYYQEGSNAECENRILCCQAKYGRPENVSNQAGRFGDSRQCDIPYSTLEIALQEIANRHPDAKLIYMNGDIVPHNIWSTSREENSNVIGNASALILKYLPNSTVVPVLGNHEPHPVNLYSPHDAPIALNTNWIYNVSFEAYKQWIPIDQSSLYLKYGYYSMNLTESFTILVINSNFCYEFNVWQTYEIGDTGNQLKWLISQLQLAENSNKTVHIVGHVPPGHDECFRIWARNYYKIMLRYNHIIKGQFYGHTHFGEFKLVYDEDGNPINNMWISPSLTPYEVNNPSYRVFYADPVNYETIDHETWIFNLRRANLNPDKVPVWQRYYSGSTTYGVQDVTPKSMGVFVENMATDEEVFKKFYEHYHKISDGDPAKECNTRCRKRILCGIVKSYYGEEENCFKIQYMVDKIVLPLKQLLQKDD